MFNSRDLKSTGVSTHGEWYKLSMEHTLAKTATLDLHPNTVNVMVRGDALGTTWVLPTSRIRKEETSQKVALSTRLAVSNIALTPKSTSSKDVPNLENVTTTLLLRSKTHAAMRSTIHSHQ